MTAATGSGAGWLAPLLPAIPGLTELDMRRLRRFEDTLVRLLAAYPAGPHVPPRLRSRHLARIRRDLAPGGYLAMAVPARDGGAGRPVVLQTLMQFICGYHDADLRDSTGLGHGRLIARHACPPVRDRWLPLLLAGALPGIAITEPCGGSRVHATTTAATAHRDGTWRLNGTKTWISRLEEAAVFAVFFKDPAGQLTAGVLDAHAPGLHRRNVRPAGLSGWTWGELCLQDAPLHPRAVLAQPGLGMDLLREHFAHYRPLVAATALGTAAAVLDQVTTHLCDRRSAGTITSLRDSALITLGRSYAQINAALLSALAAQHLCEPADGHAPIRGCAVKAHAVDVAHAAASELIPLAGAAGFQADSQMVKALGDLVALRYADGIHDSLYRAVGRALTATPAEPVSLLWPSPGVHNRLHA
jgi:alkylation response protein AidB-like acyl-CoA dehydrogenase